MKIIKEKLEEVKKYIQTVVKIGNSEDILNFMEFLAIIITISEEDIIIKQKENIINILAENSYYIDKQLEKIDDIINKLENNDLDIQKIPFTNKKFISYEDYKKEKRNLVLELKEIISNVNRIKANTEYKIKEIKTLSLDDEIVILKKQVQEEIEKLKEELEIIKTKEDIEEIKKIEKEVVKHIQTVLEIGNSEDILNFMKCLAKIIKILEEVIRTKHLFEIMLEEIEKLKEKLEIKEK